MHLTVDFHRKKSRRKSIAYLIVLRVRASYRKRNLRKSIEYLIIFRAYYVLITAAGFKTFCVYTHVFLRIHLLASLDGSGFIVLLRTVTADLLDRQIGVGLRK